MAAIGFIGADNIGSTLARLAAGAGSDVADVVVSNSRGPEIIAGLARRLGPHAGPRHHQPSPPSVSR